MLLACQDQLSPTLMSRRTFVTLATPAVMMLPNVAAARAPEVFQEEGAALSGSDPVAYFNQSAPHDGSPVVSVIWMGATWHFSTPRNRELFEMNPTRYAPEFGGYCAFAASRGYLAPTIPEAWTIYQDRLYLNASLRARSLWLRDVPGNIAKGRANWPAILG